VRVHHDENHDHTDQRQSRLKERRHPVLDELIQGLNVVAQARDDHSGAVARIETDGQRLQVGKQPHTQVLECALTHPSGQVGLRVGGNRV
jgi:hypothetical protein